MLIFSFDPAIYNMGVAVTEHNDNFFSDILKFFTMDMEKKIANLNQLDRILNSFCELKLLEKVALKNQPQKELKISTRVYKNEIQEPIEENTFKNKKEGEERKVTKKEKKYYVNQKKGKNERKGAFIANHDEQSLRLKEYLTKLIALYGKPDIVLVEKQIKVNAITNFITAQIEYEFAGITLVIEPSLKNMVKTTEDSQYHNFLLKKSSSYSANKAHAVFNMKTYAELFGIKLEKTKLDDMADAFMMVFAYLKYINQIL